MTEIASELGRWKDEGDPERRAELAAAMATRRAETLSPARRSEIARAAAVARWGRREK